MRKRSISLLNYQLYNKLLSAIHLLRHFYLPSSIIQNTLSKFSSKNTIFYSAQMSNLDQAPCNDLDHRNDHGPWAEGAAEYEFMSIQI